MASVRRVRVAPELRRALDDDREARVGLRLHPGGQRDLKEILAPRGDIRDRTGSAAGQ